MDDTVCPTCQRGGFKNVGAHRWAAHGFAVRKEAVKAYRAERERARERWAKVEAKLGHKPTIMEYYATHVD